MGRRLADSAVDRVIANPAFMTLLLPLPANKGSGSKEEVSHVVEQANTGQGKRKLMKENQKLKERLREAEAKKTKAGPSRGDGEKAAAPKRMPIKMPKELWGLSPMKHGERLCYGFQLGNCKNGKDGKCSKGLRTCVKRWKQGHGALQCSQ